MQVSVGGSEHGFSELFGGLFVDVFSVVASACHPSARHPLCLFPVGTERRAAMSMLVVIDVVA